MLYLICKNVKSTLYLVSSHWIWTIYWRVPCPGDHKGCPFQDGSLHYFCSSLLYESISWWLNSGGSELKSRDCTCGWVLKATAQAKGTFTIASVILFKFFLLFCVYRGILTACMSMCHMHAVPVDVWWGCRMPWVWRYRQLWATMWVLELNWALCKSILAISPDPMTFLLN